MWKLIDIDERYIDNGCDVDLQYSMKLRNEDGEEKTVTEGHYEFMKAYDLIQN